MLGLRKQQIKNANQIKYNSLMDLEKGSSNKMFVVKHDVLKNTLSTCVKNRQKIFSIFEPFRVTSKRKKLRRGLYVDVN